MLEFRKELSENFIYTDENNNKVTPANFFRNINNQLEQQREIQEMTKENITWTRQLIQERKEKIIQFLMIKI